MANISEAVSQKIKNMSIVCAILVVTIHVEWPKESALMSTWWVYKLLTNGISRIAVSFFFVVSGYFLSWHFDEIGWWRKESLKRVHSLLIPFVVWSLVAFLSVLPLNIIADMIAHRPLGTHINVGSESLMRMFGLDLTDYPSLFPLWYVRCLFFFVIAAPFFKFVVTKFKMAWIVFAFAVVCIFAYIPVPPEEGNRPSWYVFLSIGWSLSGMFYFSVGIYLQRFRVVFSSKVLAILCAAYGCSVLFASACLQATGRSLPIGVGLFTSPALMYAVWYTMPTCRWPTWFTGCSFPVFLMHKITFPYLEIFLKHMPPLNEQVYAYLCFVVGVVAPIVIVVCLKRWLPKLAEFAFAGRA